MSQPTSDQNNQEGYLPIQSLAPMPNVDLAQDNSEIQEINDEHALVPANQELHTSKYFNDHGGVIYVPGEDKRSPHCCWRVFCPCYYLFCCCCCCEQGMKITKMRFVGRFQKWIHVRKNDLLFSTVDNYDPVRGLLKLYAHKSGAIQELENCRINPDFSTKIRNDLEFYIPQLCCIYIHGDIDDPNDLINLILMASKSNIFFSHRIWFFFMSLIFTKDEVGQKRSDSAQLILSKLKRCCIESQELLCMVNTRDLIHYIIKFGMLKHYPDFIKHFKDFQAAQDVEIDFRQAKENNDPKAKALAEIKKFLEQTAHHRVQMTEKLIQEYHRRVEDAIRNKDFVPQQKNEVLYEIEEKPEIYKNLAIEEVKTAQISSTAKPQIMEVDSSFENPYDTQRKRLLDQGAEPKPFKIEARDIILRNFLLSDDTSPYLNKNRDYVNAYLSTPSFIKTLTDVSDDVMKYYTPEEKKIFLKRRLCEINKKLPAQVYIPFVNKSMRNYAVLNIVVEEAKIFQTKERAPLLLCIEVFRPVEMTIEEPTELYNHQDFQDMVYQKTHGVRESGNNSIDAGKRKMAMGLLGNQDRSAKYRNQQLKRAMRGKDMKAGPFDLQNRRSGGTARSQSFYSDSDSKPFSSMGVARDDFDARGKKKGKFNFMNKLKGKKKTSEQKEEDREQEELLMDDEHNQLRASSAQKPGTAEKVSNFLKSSQVQIGRKNQQLSEVFDTRASNPIHVNNVKFQIDMYQPGEIIPEGNELQFEREQDGLQCSTDLLRQASNEDLEQGRNNMDISKNTAQSNSLFHLKQLQFKSQMGQLSEQNLVPPSSSNKGPPSPQFKPGQDDESFMTADQNAVEEEMIVGAELQQANNRNMTVNLARKNQSVADLKLANKFKKETAYQVLGHAIVDQSQDDSQELDNPYAYPRSQSVYLTEQTKVDLIEGFGRYRNSKERLAEEKDQQTLKNMRSEKQNELLAYQSTMLEQKATNGEEQVENQAKVFTETNKEQENRIKKNSPFGNLLTWKIMRIIVKSNDDVRQEAFAMQLISQFDQIFKAKKLDLWMKPYEILATGPRCGLIELADDALSIDSIKKKMGRNSQIIDYFKQQFGGTKSRAFKEARYNFVQSLAAYSLLCYILQIKDRHNGNILIDIEGHIMHIDFGFFLSNAPGKGVQFEKAPFKLTAEVIEVLGGNRSQAFNEYRELMKQGFLALQDKAQKIIIIIEMMFMGQNDLPCFKGGEAAMRDLKDRFFPTGRRFSNNECQRFVDGLIHESYDNWRTRCYDNFQYYCQGIV